MEIDSTSIGAINTFLVEAGENAIIDIISPMPFLVTIEDPYQGISPLSGQTIDFNYNLMEINNPHKLRMNGIFAVRKHAVTIKNFRLAGFVRYGIWTQGCDDFTIINVDIDIDQESGLAMFIRPRGDYRPRNLTIKGDVYINGGNGHAIEFTSVDTVNIGDVTVSNNLNGCGINASGSTNIKIGNVYGYKNSYNLEGAGGGYATLRYSNAGEYLECKGIYSRRCGRGYMITQGDNSALPGVVGQHFSTVDVVDIKHTVKENIFIRGILPTHNNVLYGTASESLFQPHNLIFLEGETNTVSLGLPNVEVDTTQLKTIRINELQFGFYDVSGDQYSENYIRDRECDGFGYAKADDEIDAYMEWNISSGSGDHAFTWKYASTQSKKAKFLVNGKYVCTIEFSGTGTDSLWQTNTLRVRGVIASEIKNIKLVALEYIGLPLIDYLEVEALGVARSLKDISTATDSMNVTIDPISSVDVVYNLSEFKSLFAVYPNPTTGVLTIVTNKRVEAPVDVKIHDAHGLHVRHIATETDNGLVIQLHNCQSGMYLLRISSLDFHEIFKITCL